MCQVQHSPEEGESQLRKWMEGLRVAAGYRSLSAAYLKESRMPPPQMSSTTAAASVWWSAIYVGYVQRGNVSRWLSVLGNSHMLKGRMFKSEMDLLHVCFRCYYISNERELKSRVFTACTESPSRSYTMSHELRVTRHVWIIRAEAYVWFLFRGEMIHWWGRGYPISFGLDELEFFSHNLTE